MRGVYLRLFSQYVEKFPVPRGSTADKKAIVALVEQLSTEMCPNQPELEAELNDRVVALYGLTKEEQRIVDRQELREPLQD